MARKELVHVITAEGRDKGKIFHLKEMPASKAEAWAFRLFLALANTSVQLPPNLTALGFAGVAQLGIRMLSGLKWEAAKPLLEEMFECVQIQRDPGTLFLVKPTDDDIEEPATRVELRVEVWKLHTDFLKAAASSTSASETSASTSTLQST